MYAIRSYYAFRGPGNNMIFEKRIRITSYNVCYTKLLRDIVRGPVWCFLSLILGKGPVLQYVLEELVKIMVKSDMKMVEKEERIKKAFE